MSCEYCNGDKPIIEDDNRGLNMFVDDFGKTLDIAWYGDNGWEAESIPIMHCPMCGSKLGDSDVG